MRRLILLCLWVIPGTLFAVNLAAENSPFLERDEGFTVTAYAPGYALWSIEQQKLEQVDRVIYFGIGIRSDGRVAMPPQADLELLRTWAQDTDVSLYLGLVDHVGSRPDPQQGFGRILRSEMHRDRFFDSLMAVLEVGPFDGIDIDWEWPQRGWETEEYGRFLTQLVQRVRPEGLGVSIAVSPWQTISWEAAIGLTHVHLMLYDNFGHHSNIDDMKRDVEGFLARTGINPQRVTAGLPFYGRGITAQGKKWTSAVSYRTLVSRYKVPKKEDTIEGYAFNSRQTIIEKTLFALNAGLGGVMIWHLGMDSTGPESLLSAIRNTINYTPRAGLNQSLTHPPALERTLTPDPHNEPESETPATSDDPRSLAILSGRQYQASNNRRKQLRSLTGLPDPVHGLVPQSRRFSRLKEDLHWWWEHPDWLLFFPGL